ncbi:terpene synthase [Dactylosporangium aurantiacum]|uniref:Terpene synthase n=1 Tax=Dactylosporangium aurantiacum TaxID=35754 RepID=A0A9Q9INL1_9ACTN|nr:terpene synthase family protein [Dactylosporangium aurantiacum]MDG6105629.1 terpene synthase family protein [Dactylosporangium aurantiacum]UWZ57037.1 terpene synthase [Dactylosporangium aurantiacum]
MTAIADLLAPREAGAVCAVASHVQRDLIACAGAYPDLFPAKPFDGPFFSTIALANTFCAPWLSAGQLRPANRITMWIFAVDRLMDLLATTQAEIDDIVARCLAVVDGTPAPAGDQLAGLLAEIRAELATSPAFPALAGIWQDDVRRMLESMARDWRWKSDPARALPTLDEYLAGAEFGYSLVFLSHWIATTAAPVTDVDALVDAGRLVQRIIRILNDYGTYERDVTWGDVNALLLGVDRETVDARLAELIAQAGEQLAPLMATNRPLAVFLARHITFNQGFYGLADYWGSR